MFPKSLAAMRIAVLRHNMEHMGDNNKMVRPLIPRGTYYALGHCCAAVQVRASPRILTPRFFPRLQQRAAAEFLDVKEKMRSYLPQEMAMTRNMLDDLCKWETWYRPNHFIVFEVLPGEGSPAPLPPSFLCPTRCMWMPRATALLSRFCRSIRPSQQEWETEEEVRDKITLMMSDAALILRKHPVISAPVFTSVAFEAFQLQVCNGACVGCNKLVPLFM